VTTGNVLTHLPKAYNLIRIADGIDGELMTLLSF
jgi:hypothetical protein